MLWWEIVITIWWSVGLIFGLAIEIRNLSDENPVNREGLGTYKFLMRMIKSRNRFNIVGKIIIIPVYTVLAALCIIPFYSLILTVLIIGVCPYYAIKYAKPTFKFVFMDKNYNRVG